MALSLADPAHPAFPSIRREQRAVIYDRLGWSQQAIADELDCHRTTIRYWVDPDWRARKRAAALARHHARKTKEARS